MKEGTIKRKEIFLNMEIPGLGKHCTLTTCKRLGKFFIDYSMIIIFVMFLKPIDNRMTEMITIYAYQSISIGLLIYKVTRQLTAGSRLFNSDYILVYIYNVVIKLNFYKINQIIQISLTQALTPNLLRVRKGYKVRQNTVSLSACSAFNIIYADDKLAI